MATVEQLQAEVVELKEQITILKRLMGETGAGFRSVSISTSSLLGPFSSLINATASGATGLGAYNDTLANGTKLLADFGSKLGTFGSIIGAMGDAGSAYAQAAARQGDELYKAYQGLAAVGAAGQERSTVRGAPEKSTFNVITDLANQFGIVSAQELPKFVQMISQSSETLAKFGGTVYDGMKAFGSLANSVQNTGLQTEFLNMGMTVDSINKGLAGYLKMQTLAAAGQMKTQQELNAGAGEYLRNLDMLSKLTGKNVEQLQKEQEDALLDEKYSIHQRQLEQKAAAGDLEAKQQLAEEMKAMAQAPDSVKKGLQAAFTGYGMQFEEGRKLYMSAPEAFNQAAKGVGFNANQFLDTAKGEFKRTMDTFGDLIMAAGNSLFVFVGDMRKIENLQGTAEGRTATALELQRRQKEQTDQAVAGSTALSQMQRDATRDLNQFVNIGVVPAIFALSKLAEYARNAADLLPGAQPRTAEQQQRQGYGGQVGQPGTGGRSSAQVESAAKDSVKNAIDDYTKKIAEADRQIADLEKRRDAATGDQRKALEKELSDIGILKKSIVDVFKALSITEPRLAPPAAPAVPVPEMTPRPIIDSITADIGRGVLNIASVENIRFPNMPAQNSTSVSASGSDLRFPNMQTQYSTSVSASGSDLRAKEDLLKPFQQFASDKTPNSQVTESNIMLAGKMDELISLMRTSGSYLQKISIKDYA